MSEDKAKLAVFPSREEREHQALLTVMGQMLDGLNHLEGEHVCIAFECSRSPITHATYRVKVWDMDSPIMRSAVSPILRLDDPPHWCNLAHLINAAIELLRKQKTEKPTTMITKAKKLTFTTSDGHECPTVDGAKKVELAIFCGADNDTLAMSAFDVLVAKPREAIAILKFGLPRKPRTVKGKVGRPRKPNPAPIVTNPTKA